MLVGSAGGRNVDHNRRGGSSVAGVALSATTSADVSTGAGETGHRMLDTVRRPVCALAPRRSTITTFTRWVGGAGSSRLNSFQRSSTAC
jgi:hypothetical protein